MREYTCTMCLATYESDWTDEDAEAEMRATFGDLPEEERAIICDDCYRMVMSVVDHRDVGSPVQ